MRIFISGPPLVGKAQPIYSKVLTPDGFTNIGNIQIGDSVISQDGSISKVLGVYPQETKKEVFEIEFKDGRKAYSSGDHLWRAWIGCSVWDKFRKKKKHVRDWRVITLYKIKHKLDNKTYDHNRLGIPLYNPPINNTNAIDLPCDPYLLGVLIGDGNLTRGTFRLSSPDKFIIDKIKEKARNYGVEVKKVKGRKLDYSLTSGGSGLISNPLTIVIKQLGLNVYSHEKFIPQVFFSGSTKQKLELIQGLLDTDGTVDSRGVMSFSTSSYQLSKDFQELVWSLGGYCSIGIKEAPKYTHNGENRIGKRSYVVHLSHHEPYLFFTLPKKLNRICERKNQMKLNIKSVRYIGEQKCICISLDNDSGLYITDNYVVTHNTTLSEQFKDECFHTDSLCHLEWSQQSDEVAKSIDDPSVNLMEGTAVVRGLRKWLDDNDGKPCDVLIWMSNPKAAWTRNHQRMASSMNTIMEGIYDTLCERGTDVIGFGSYEEEDEIHIF